MLRSSVLARFLVCLLVVGLTISPYPILRAADHRDAPGVNTRADGDIGDVFAFLNPNDSSRLVLIMGVNSFANPASPSYRFGRDLLYQFKIDNNGDAVEDYVVQAVFEGTGGVQTAKIYGPARPSHTGAKNKVLGGQPLTGNTGTAFGDSAGLQVFAGLREDPFVTDVGQVFRILNGTQEVFRDLPSTPVGPLRGRSVRANGTSGTDGFGGFNGSFIIVEFPKSWIRGGTSRVHIWGTVSASVPDAPGQPGIANGRTFVQFERMGQQLINTVFVPGPLKDEFNNSIPSEDVAKFSHLIPDALTINDNDGTGNTIAGRRAVLNFLGLTSLPNGAPLALPAGFGNTNRGLLRAALLPDVLRLDLDLAPTDLGVGLFGLQNGRRPGDDVTDIALRLLRELADVNFPAALNGVVGFTVPGTGPARPGALNFPSDRRVFVVLQGTDFYEPDADIADLSGAGNEKAIPTTFPYLAAPHPLPGEPGTVGYPPVN